MMSRRVWPDVFHDDVWQTLGIAAFGRNQFFSRIVDVHDVRVVHLGHGVCFAAKRARRCRRWPHRRMIFTATVRPRRVSRHVDLGHAATTDELAKLVASAGNAVGHCAHCLFPPNLEAGAQNAWRAGHSARGSHCRTWPWRCRPFRSATSDRVLRCVPAAGTPPASFTSNGSRPALMTNSRNWTSTESGSGGTDCSRALRRYRPSGAGERTMPGKALVRHYAQ